MNYRINKERLIDTLRGWDPFLKRKVHLIACGGTALTLLGIKESTKDIDFMIAKENEYSYLIKILKQLGYRQINGSSWAKDDVFIIDFFIGNKIHTTQLLKSPLEEGQNMKVLELENIYLGVLNYYDLLISKIFRSTSVDIDDCLLLLKSKKDQIDREIFIKHYHETASYDISQERYNRQLESFLKKWDR